MNSCIKPFNITDKKVVDSLSVTLDYSGKYLGDYEFPSDCKLATISLPIINITLSIMKEGDTFGDVALNRAENKRTASIITTTECTFGTITKEEYDFYIKESQDKLNKMYMDTIFSISLFKEINADFFAKTFFPLFKPEVYYRNQFLFEQNTPRNAIYILHSGQIEISLKSNIRDVNNIITSLNTSSSSVVNDYELLKQYGTHITQSSNIKEFYKEMQKFKVLLVNKSDIIGLDEYLKVNKIQTHFKKCEGGVVVVYCACV